MYYGASDEIDPFWRGYQDCLDGKGFDQNPYAYIPNEPPIKAQRWTDGWTAARDQMER